MSEQKEQLTYQIPHEIVLEFPFDYGSEKVDKVTFIRRLKAKDFKGIRTNNIRFDEMLSLISRSTGESITKIEELDSADMMKCIDVVNSFLPDGPTTGENG